MTGPHDPPAPAPAPERTGWLPVLSLLLIGLLVYGLYLAKLGFYWDDWPVIWIFRSHGTAGIHDYFSGERPIQGWFYMVAASCLGAKPLGWQLAAVGARCASSLFLFSALTPVWPQRRYLAWFVAAFVLLYPGFTQQSVALTYLPHHVSFLCFAISLAATVGALTQPRRRWLLLALSLLFAAPGYTITEYYLGLELLRLAIVVTLVSRSAGTRRLANLLGAWWAWLPNGLVWVTCIVWRSQFKTASYYGEAHNYKTLATAFQRIAANPVHELFTRFEIAFQNVLLGGGFAWLRPLDPQILLNWRSASTLLSWAIGFFVVGLALVVARKLTSGPAAGPVAATRMPPWLLEPGVYLGLIALSFAGLPLAASGLRIQYSNPPPFDDRFTLPFMVGASLLLVGLLSVPSIRPLARQMVLACLLGVFGIFGIWQANQYRHDWLTQKQFFWQLAWRLPGLQSGAGIFIDGLPYSLYRNHSAGVLDLLYLPPGREEHLHYFVFDLSWLASDQASFIGRRLSLRPDESITGGVRSFHYEGNTSRTVVAWVSPGGTLRVLTQPYEDEIVGLSPLCARVAYLSHPERVTAAEAAAPVGPLLGIFGAEPRHEWNYFFQRAGFERQHGRWSRVADLADEAIRGHWSPADASEWLPFVEAYARTGRIEAATKLSVQVLDACPTAVMPLSHIWQRILSEERGQAALAAPELAAFRARLILSPTTP
jgi:hypothetical protein